MSLLTRTEQKKGEEKGEKEEEGERREREVLCCAVLCHGEAQRLSLSRAGDSNARLTNMLRNDKYYVCVCVCLCACVDRIIKHCDRLVGRSVGRWPGR